MKFMAFILIILSLPAFATTQLQVPSGFSLSEIGGESQTKTLSPFEGTFIHEAIPGSHESLQYRVFTFKLKDKQLNQLKKLHSQKSKDEDAWSAFYKRLLDYKTNGTRKTPALVPRVDGSFAQYYEEWESETDGVVLNSATLIFTVESQVFAVIYQAYGPEFRKNQPQVSKSLQFLGRETKLAK